MRPGVVSIPHGHEIANVNCLTDLTKVDKMTGMVLYTGVPIILEPEPLDASESMLGHAATG